ncbi:MAG: uroporphyrinogen-III C-methyltransferase [Gammaproteobacteria bacterium]|nr:uroporphyrinogen-III C-methyltransferase [Gammaproteobacteria bacterium]
MDIKEQPAQPKHSNVTGIIAIVIAVLAILLGGLNGWLNFRHHDLSAMQTSLNNTRVESETSYRNLQQQMQQQWQTLAQTQQHLANLNRYASRGTSQQKLSEVAFLIHLANLHLTVNNDANNAKHLLNLAQARLNDIPDPNLSHLKSMLKKDILTLSKASQVNFTSILTRLNALSLAVNQLKSYGPEQFNPANTSAAPNEKLAWYKRILKRFSDLKTLVVVRHLDDRKMPSLLPHQSAYLKAIIQTKILQAQWAILHRQPRLYRESLEFAKQLLQQYFHNAPKAAEITTELDQLVHIHIDQKLPQISNSLQALAVTTDKMLRLPQSLMMPGPALPPRPKAKPKVKPSPQARSGLET